MPLNSKKLLIPAKPEWQAGYVERLLRQANELDAEFVLHWGYRDLDQLQALLDGGGGPFDSTIHGFASLSKDCGLIDENGNPRPSFDVWRRWYEAERR